MAVKSSGSLSITTDIVGEFGGQAPHSLSEYYRNGANVPDAGANSAVPTSGEISFADFYGAVSELGVTITSNTTDLNLLDAIEAVYGTQSLASVYRVTIDSGVTITASASAPNNSAVTWGDFPNGSTITLVVNGSILGRSGAGGTGGAGATGHSTAPSGTAGGAGGDTIYANYSNQTMNVVNNGAISAGGGGSGGGGGGGKGGDGVLNPPTPPFTPYYYSRTSFGSTRYYWHVGTSYTVYWWAGISGDTVTPPNATSDTSTDYYLGGYVYERGTLQETIYNPGDKLFPAGNEYYYSVRRRAVTTGSPTTYDGGNGGAGGNGQPGVGSNTNTPSQYWGSNPGSSGSTGPGSAGNGGTGGASGAIGGFGVAGTPGSTGASGTAGNTSPGASSGGSGGAGGAAGRYIVKGSNTVTFTGSGTTAGGIS